MPPKTTVIGNADLFNQFFDVLIQCIELSLHGHNNSDQFFTAEGIQFVQCMFPIASAPLILYLLYMIIKKKANWKLRHYAYGCDTVKHHITKGNIRFSKCEIFVINASEADINVACAGNNYVHADVCMPSFDPEKILHFAQKNSRLF